MGFLDKVKETAKVVGEKASVAGKTIADKTSDAVETGKIKNKINGEKKAIDDIKKQIGELVWTKFAAGESMGDDLAALCATIVEHNDAINGFEEQLTALKEAGKEVAEEVAEEVEEVKDEVTE